MEELINIHSENMGLARILHIYEHGSNNGGFQSGMKLFRGKELGFVFMTNSDKGEEFNRVLEWYISAPER